VIDDAVLQREGAFADLSFDAADEVEIFAEHHGLADQTFAPQMCIRRRPNLAIAKSCPGILATLPWMELLTTLRGP